MKIAMVASPYVPVPPVKYGGTERVIYYAIKGLQELGHEVILIGTGDSKVDCEIIPIVPEALWFGKTVEEHEEIKKRIGKLDEKTEDILRKLQSRVDIIHSHGFDLINFQNFPNLTTLHGKFTLSQVEYFEKRKGLYFVSISKNQQESSPELQYAGVVYNGLDPSIFPFIEKPEDYFCFLGRLDTEKDPASAIQLAIQMGKKLKIGAKLDYLGGEYFETKVKPYFDHPLIEFMGELNDKQKIKLISHAKCNLHPTNFREPFGLTVLETAYCGTPTLAIKRGSMPELIEEGRTGILVEDFAEGYHKAKECDQMDRKYISERSRMLFNYKTMAKQYELAYEKVLEAFKKRESAEYEELQKDMQTTRELISRLWRTE